MVLIPSLMGVTSLVIILAAVIIATISYRRLSRGELKKTLKWLLVGLYFMAIPYTLFIAQEVGMLEHIHETISWIIYSFMIIVALCLIRSSLIFNKFSKAVGFAKPEEKFAEAFITGVKGGRKK